MDIGSSAAAPKRGTPAWLDLDLSLRSRRILFAIAASLGLFALWLHYTCAPGDMTDPEFDSGSLCGSLGSGGDLGSPTDRWGIVFLVLLCVLLCCPCFSIAGHGEFYETFPLIRQARDRYMAQKLASLNDQRARKGLPPLPLHNTPAHASGAEQSHTSQKLRF